MIWEVYIADMYSRGAKSHIISRQMSFEVEANTEEEGEAKAWARWDEQYNERPEGSALDFRIAPALRQPRTS